MCLCNPNIRTPFCGKPGCEIPNQIRPTFMPTAHLETLSIEALEKLEGRIIVVLIRKRSEALYAKRATCKHEYSDGSPSFAFKGMFTNPYQQCTLCDKIKEKTDGLQRNDGRGSQET